MRNWFRSKIRDENEQLRCEVAELRTKQAQPEIIADASTPFAGQSNLAGHREQLNAFTGHAFTAVSAIAKRVAGQQLFVSHEPTLRTAKHVGDNLEPLLAHPLLASIDDPNPFMVRWSLLYVTVASLELTGKSFWWLRDVGHQFEIWPLPVHWVQPIHEADSLFARWLVRPPNNPTGFELSGEEVAYFALPDPSDPLGAKSPLSSQAKAVNADDAIQNAQESAFANGVHPSVAIRLGEMIGPNGTKGGRPELSDAQRQQLIQSVRRAYAGVLRRGEPIILDSLIEEVFQFSTKPSEMDFTESGKTTKSRIFEAFGVNPIVVGQVENANRASSWVAEHHFCENVINPLLTLLGQCLTKSVAPRFTDGMRRLVVWFEPCVAHDQELKLKAWQIGLERGAVTVNEYRRHILNLPDTDSSMGDLLAEPQEVVMPSKEAFDPYTLGPIETGNGHAKRF